MSHRCLIGTYHTVTLSDDGVIYTFGENYVGQLGLGNNQSTTLIPTPISNLPKINQIACGWNFTICVDEDGILWKFGELNASLFKKGSTLSKTKVPTQIQNIPPVHSVACGYEHILIITNNSDLWSCGNNEFGQLCLGDLRNQPEFQQTSFSNISKISVGGFYSLFQNGKGEIYACGSNDNGELGFGHFKKRLIIPTLIPNLPSNIVQFVCSFQHNLFLDSDGNVFSVGANYYGQLGLDHSTNQNVLNQIVNIPPVKAISCVSASSYLVDFEGNVWSFGYNGRGQLGHGDTTQKNVPTKIEGLINIQQISHGSSGSCFLAKDSQNKIFVTGYNTHGQLGTGDKESSLTPKEINSQYCTIWGREVLNSKAKSARK